MDPTDKKIDIDEIAAFLRSHGWPIVLRGMLSLVAVMAVLALYYAFAPREECYQQEVLITLESKSGQTVYPNGRQFSSTDLISSPVLSHVWAGCNLADRVEFEDFCKWFSLVGYDRERSKLDAEYQAKMSKRNVTVTELATLQLEYETKLAAQKANNRYVLAMKPTCALADATAVGILTAVPAAWFAESSVLNAPQMPAMMRADVLSAYVKRLRGGDGRALELVDALRLYRNEIAETCNYVRHKLLRGRIVMIDGVDLGAYESRLELVRSELLRIKNRLLVNGDPADLEGFVAARLDDMACETMAVEGKEKAMRQTIDLLKDRSGFEGEGAKRGGAVADGNVTLQADASFFRDFKAMVRREASQESVQKYADELSQYAKDLADIKARKLYYDQIGEYVSKTRARTNAKVSMDALFTEVEAYTSELLDVGAKVMDFRDRALALYRTPDQFYALPESARYGRSFRFPIARLALGLAALWMLYNLVFLVGAWKAKGK